MNEMMKTLLASFPHINAAIAENEGSPTDSPLVNMCIDHAVAQSVSHARAVRELNSAIERGARSDGFIEDFIQAQARFHVIATILFVIEQSMKKEVSLEELEKNVRDWALASVTSPESVRSTSPVSNAAAGERNSAAIDLYRAISAW